ncbi:hypothetical protein BGZ73_003540 [Actinomortierella ambigua]|nr:hypothetical protein BGZ73_003540 [Actinomortierella ambigua]
MSIGRRYKAWRRNFVKTWGDMVYIDYNHKHEQEPRNAVTCSEAIGYGMLISVLMKNQSDFDGLLRWFFHFRNKNGLCSWQQVKKGNGFQNTPDGGDSSATDGDIDIATSLFYASHVWGRSKDGRVDYRQEGIKMAKAIWEKEINPYTFMPTLGDWVEIKPNRRRSSDSHRNSQQGVLSAFKYGDEDKHAGATRPSDFILAGFLTFYHEDIERSQQWARVMDSIIMTVQHNVQLHPNTGLIADFLRIGRSGYYEPHPKQILESENDKDYNWNSCRVPWRLSVYYLLTHDPRVLPALQAEANFFGSQKEIYAGYHLNGKRLSDRSYNDLAYTAPASICMWVTQHPNLKRVQKEMSELESDKSYFGDSIQLLCLLQAKNPRGCSRGAAENNILHQQPMAGQQSTRRMAKKAKLNASPSTEEAVHSTSMPAAASQTNDSEETEVLSHKARRKALKAARPLKEKKVIPKKPKKNTPAAAAPKRPAESDEEDDEEEDDDEEEQPGEDETDAAQPTHAGQSRKRPLEEDDDEDEDDEEPMEPVRKGGKGYRKKVKKPSGKKGKVFVDSNVMLNILDQVAGKEEARIHTKQANMAKLMSKINAKEQQKSVKQQARKAVIDKKIEEIKKKKSLKRKENKQKAAEQEVKRTKDATRRTVSFAV